MKLERKRELAFGYVHEALEPGDKMTVFDLILKDEVFRQYLKEEVELKSRMNSLKTSLNPMLKSRLLAEIRWKAENEFQVAAHDGGASSDGFPSQAEKVLEATPALKVTEPNGAPWIVWSEWVLQMTLPPLIVPLMKTLQRRCLT